MRLERIIFVLLLLIFCNVSLKSQVYRTKPENFFGIQVKPLIPFGLVGDQSFEMEKEGFETTLSPKLGYSYGGVVRIGLTELLAIETGVSYLRRNYRADYTIPDSNVVAKDEVGYVSFEVPINFLVYIKLGKQLFMNVGIGGSTNFNASNIRSGINPEGKYQFILEGRRFNYFDFNVNADVGVEYRTRESGTFYLGVSGRVPFSPTLEIATEFRYGTESVVTREVIEGSTFAFSLKYFFHNQKRNKDIKLQKGPIEQ